MYQILYINNIPPIAYSLLPFLLTSGTAIQAAAGQKQWTPDKDMNSSNTEACYIVISLQRAVSFINIEQCLDVTFLSKVLTHYALQNPQTNMTLIADFRLAPTLAVWSVHWMLTGIL